MLRQSAHRLAAAGLGLRTAVAQQQQALGTLPLAAASLSTACVEAATGGRSVASALQLQTLGFGSSLPLAARSVATSAALAASKDTLYQGGKPKAGPNAYSLYTSQQFHPVRDSLPPRPDGKPAATTDVMRELGKRWKSMSLQEKKKYQDQAAQDHQNVAFKEYKERQKVITTSGYKLFIQEALPQYRERTPVPEADTPGQASFKHAQQAFKSTAEGWKALTDEQKAIYANKAKAIRDTVLPPK